MTARQEEENSFIYPTNCFDVAVILTKVANAIGTPEVFKLWIMPVRRYLKRRLQDLMMFFEALLRLILYLGPQRAVGHVYEEGKFQQEPIISLMVEPCCFYPIWKTGTDKKYQILKKISNQQFEQFLTIHLHKPTVFFNLFKIAQKGPVMCYSK